MCADVAGDVNDAAGNPSAVPAAGAPCRRPVLGPGAGIAAILVIDTLPVAYRFARNGPVRAVEARRRPQAHGGSSARGLGG